MAIKAQKHRAALHRLRDNLHRAERAAKRGITGAAELVKMHSSKRAAYIEANRVIVKG